MSFINQMITSQYTPGGFIDSLYADYYGEPLKREQFTHELIRIGYERLVRNPLPPEARNANKRSSNASRRTVNLTLIASAIALFVLETFSELKYLL